MEIRVLRYFLAVAQEESISAAAESLHLSQPTLSRQLMDLEEELGRKLFLRGSRRITLTEDGLLLRKRAEEIVTLVDKTRSAFQDAGEEIAGDIYICSGETDGVRYLARAAGELRRLYPRICCHISSGDGADVRERLEKGLADFGVVLGEIGIEQYDSLKIPFQDVWGVLIPREHPLAQKAVVCPEDLWDQPLILSRQSTKGSALERWFRRSLNQLNIAATYSLIFNASILVQEGLGLAVGLDKLINTTGESSLCFRPLEPRLETNLYVIWKKYQVFSKAAEQYLTQLQKDFGGVKQLQYGNSLLFVKTDL